MAWQDSGFAERETVVDFDRGLFVLRYAAGPAIGPAPAAFARPAYGDSAIEFLSRPGVESGALDGPGDCLVVRAERGARLILRIRAARGGSLDASFQIEPLAPSLAESRSSSATQAWASSAQPERRGLATAVANGFYNASAPGEAGELELFGHVAWRGDIVAPRGGWIGGPSSPVAIEGFGLRGVLPPGVGLDVQVLVASTRPRWLDWTPFGGLAGTRGRSLPLSGLRLRLNGQASAHELHVEALFLGSSIVSRRGREIELVAASSVEPLVGLKVDLVSAAAQAVVEPLVVHAPAAPSVDGAPRGSKIRVFRAAAEPEHLPI